MKWLCSIVLGLVVILLAPDAWAWGPAAHLYYGVTILEQLASVTEGVRAVLVAHPLAFLYGCVSADIVLAKKLGRSMTHCHRWTNGLKLIENASTERLRSFALGYDSHLAADSISHNCYVPSRTVLSYDSGILKHVYWEMMFDRKVTSQRTLNLFHRIARGDFADCDDYLESQIPSRLFDFSTNKRIFNQLLLLQGLHYWQRLWVGISEKSPWPLEDREVQDFCRRSVAAIFSFLNEERESSYLSLDPTGRDRLRAAHELRRHFRKSLARNRPLSASHVRSVADRFARDPFTRIDADLVKDEPRQSSLSIS